METIRTRRSVRKFAPAAIGKDEERILLEAGMCAPSAHGCRPWRFLVVRDQARREGIAARHPYAKMCAGAAMAIVVCADLSVTKESAFWPQDCAAATENILLAARDLGLGAVWISGFPKAERTEPLKAFLGIPREIELFCTIAIGAPAEEPRAGDRYDARFVHEERWGE